jgi:hypothetical protein
MWDQQRPIATITIDGSIHAFEPELVTPEVIGAANTEMGGEYRAGGDHVIDVLLGQVEYVGHWSDATDLSVE